MKILQYLLLLFAVVNTSNCKRTCENVKVGEVEYSATALSFFNYSDGEKITFVSSKGNTIEFTVDLVEEVYFICQKITCDPLDPYKSSYCEYLEAPQNTILLMSDSTLIALTATLQSYEPETDLIYEYVRFTLSHNNDSAAASYITDVRFTSPEFDKGDLTDIDAFVEERSSILLNDQTFTDVMVCEDEKLTLVYQRGKGFVGFSISGEVFTLQQ
jgi:hypothetical protein